jgi:hypothetical protein
MTLKKLKYIPLDHQRELEKALQDISECRESYIDVQVRKVMRSIDRIVGELVDAAVKKERGL